MRQATAKLNMLMIEVSAAAKDERQRDYRQNCPQQYLITSRLTARERLGINRSLLVGGFFSQLDSSIDFDSEDFPHRGHA